MKTFTLLFAIFYISLLTVSLYSNEADIIKISDDIYAFITHGPGRDYVDGNSVLIITPQGALVIDTRTDTKSAEEEIAEIKKLTSVPVKYIVNTHWHYDHMLGNSRFRDAFPGVTIIAHENCLAEMNQFVPGALGKEPGTSYEQIAAFTQELESGKDSQGKVLTEYEKSRRKQVITDIELFLAYPLPVFSPPDVTFDSAMTIYFGDLEIRIFAPSGGKAHTTGDAMVYCCGACTLCAGDLCARHDKNN
jgi:cyclase